MLRDPAREPYDYNTVRPRFASSAAFIQSSRVSEKTHGDTLSDVCSIAKARARGIARASLAAQVFTLAGPIRGQAHLLIYAVFWALRPCGERGRF
jgi:hypothetical protein